MFIDDSSSDHLRVEKAQGLTLVVKAGRANINGAFYWQKDDETITLEQNIATKSYNIILRLNDNDAYRNITLVASDINNGITRNDSIYDLVLATVTVTGNANEVKGSDITDTRLDSTRCGAVTSAIKSVQSLDLFTQVTELFKEIKAQNESEMNANRTEFNDWFETVKDTLDSDTAGKLSNRISDVENMIMDNHFTTILLTGDGTLVDENGHEILSDWAYKVDSGDVTEEHGCKILRVRTEDAYDKDLNEESNKPVQNKVLKQKFDTMLSSAFEIRSIIKTGYTVDSNGLEVENASNFVTDYIKVEKGNTYKWSQKDLDFVARYFDGGYNYINRVIDTEFTPEEDRIKYCRFVGTTSKVSDIDNLHIIETIPLTKCKDALNQYKKTDVIIVSKQGGDYKTISNAVKSCNDGDTILVMPGVYEEILTEYPYTQKQYHLIGFDRNSCIIRANSGDYADSPLCFRGYSIENLTIENINANGEDASNGLSYALHLDFGKSGDEVHIRNCTFRCDWFASVGIGTRANCDYVFENCTFIENSGNETGAVFFHNCQKEAYYGANQHLRFINCVFNSKAHNLMVQGWGLATIENKLEVDFVNCNFWAFETENNPSDVFIQKGTFSWSDYINISKRSYGNNIETLNG